MNELSQNYGPWYQNEGPTVEEMKKDVKEKLMDTGPYSIIWEKKVPYLYLKAINHVFNSSITWPLVSWRGWRGVKDYKQFKIFENSNKKYNEFIKIRAKKKLAILLEPYIIHRLYRFPDGLRIKKVRESWYQGII
tara:strand:+ start:1473 stop:1877 length:405 start_codon:yes stop_codon:yes gene_type:complete